MPVPPVSKEPEIALVRWGILMLPGGQMYLSGLRQDREAKGRTTTALVSIDAAAGAAETESGRRYRLVGPPDDGTALEVACMSWGRIQAAYAQPMTAEEAELMLEGSPSSFVM
ncbi:hypothetical protein [Oricola sp.]|uniref:hypothetical protein n=1 Tax=Oricola sp. TaxID=1979950 RepID=UPI00320BDDE6|nr:hypothetical protein [Oricola sp.]